MTANISEGMTVVYVDSVGRQQNALVTNCWGYREIDTEKPDTLPSLNLVVVSEDATKTDPYGRQLERFTSVVHKSKQAAPGFYWYLPGEVAA